MTPSGHTRKRDDTDWGRLATGIHICSIYRNEEEKTAQLAAFFWSGFDKRERPMYFYDEKPPAPSDDGMEIFHYTDVYLADGEFDPKKMIEKLEKTVVESLDNGFTGIRAAGEMSWVHKSGTPYAKYLEYESRLNNFYPKNKVIGICQFDKNKFSEEFLADMIRTHPYLLLYGKLYQNRHFYAKPEQNFSSSEHEDYETMVSTIQAEEPLIA